MKLQTIAENRFTELAQKLNNEVQQVGKRDLQDLVENPSETVRLIQKGMVSKQFILADEDWVQQFLKQWILLKDNKRDIEKIFEHTIQLVEKKYRSLQGENERQNPEDQSKTEDLLRHDLIISEGIGGFLGKLAKWTLLVIQLLAIGSGGNSRYKSGQQIEDNDLRILNPFAVNNLTKELYSASIASNNKPKTATGPISI